MAEDIKENEMKELHSIDYVRAMSGGDSGKISKSEFIKILNIISSDNALFLGSGDDMNDLKTCTFWAYKENGLPKNGPSFTRFSGISMNIGNHSFQIAFNTYGGIEVRGSYDKGQSWSEWG